MASFVIAFVVLGLDVLLGVVVVLGIARSGSGTDSDYELTQDLKRNLLGGAMAMVCLNCLSLPACLVGAGLAVVGLGAQRDKKHLFTWIGLIGNGAVILGILGLFVLSQLAK